MGEVLRSGPLVEAANKEILKKDAEVNLTVVDLSGAELLTTVLQNDTTGLAIKTMLFKAIPSDHIVKALSFSTTVLEDRKPLKSLGAEKVLTLQATIAEKPKPPIPRHYEEGELSD